MTYGIQDQNNEVCGYGRGVPVRVPASSVRVSLKSFDLSFENRSFLVRFQDSEVMLLLPADFFEGGRACSGPKMFPISPVP
jgi:hypothetical protein